MIDTPVMNMIERLDDEDLERIYARSFENIDLRFKNLKKSGIPAFKKRTLRGLNVFRNDLLKPKS